MDLSAQPSPWSTHFFLVNSAEGERSRSDSIRKTQTGGSLAIRPGVIAVALGWQYDDTSIGLVDAVCHPS